MRSGPPSAIRRAAAAVLACLALTAVATPAAPASERVSPAAPAAGESAAKIAEYWTPRRMRSTPPLGGSRAGAGDNPFAVASFAPVAEPTVLPYSLNGRLFVRRGKERGYCSATAIDTESRRLVLTAAHCLNSGPVGRKRGNVWSRYLEFVPAYTDGTAPFGAFIARRKSVFVPRQWAKFGNPNYDVGAIVTAPNAEGVQVADAVGGGAAIVVDRSRRQEFQTFGYPGKVHRLQACESPYVGDDALTYRIPGPPTIAIHCRWAPGASGGGWLIEGGTEINGLTSYGKRRDKVHTFSPYFSRRNVGNLVAGL